MIGTNRTPMFITPPVEDNGMDDIGQYSLHFVGADCWEGIPHQESINGDFIALIPLSNASAACRAIARNE
jgi:hypothetical protein